MMDLDPATERAKWATMDLDARIEELVKWIKDGTPEQARARIHALTRPFTMKNSKVCTINGHSTAGTPNRFSKTFASDMKNAGSTRPNKITGPPYRSPS